GTDFISTIEIAVLDLSDDPGKWPVIGKGIRRRILPRFPYSGKGKRCQVLNCELRRKAMVELIHNSRFDTFCRRQKKKTVSP
ncbi:MAG: hypothetical protein PF482_14355, partial [Desulfobacteraceae bacterium]|nr:hypothetical protein [Desulfobacteraceae bacterium]